MSRPVCASAGPLPQLKMRPVRMEVNPTYQCRIEALNKPEGNIARWRRKCRRTVYRVTGFGRFKDSEEDGINPFFVSFKDGLRKSGLWVKRFKASMTSLSRCPLASLTFLEGLLAAEENKT